MPKQAGHKFERAASEYQQMEHQRLLQFCSATLLASFLPASGFANDKLPQDQTIENLQTNAAGFYQQGNFPKALQLIHQAVEVAGNHFGTDSTNVP